MNLMSAAMEKLSAERALLMSQTFYTAAAAAFCGGKGADLLNDFRDRLKQRL